MQFHKLNKASQLLMALSVTLFNHQCLEARWSDSQQKVKAGKPITDGTLLPPRTLRLSVLFASWIRQKGGISKIKVNQIATYPLHTRLLHALVTDLSKIY